MEEKCFRTFIEAVRFLEKEDLDRDSIKSAITKLIKKFERELSQEQMLFVTRMFPFYEEKKRSKLLEESLDMDNDFF